MDYQSEAKRILDQVIYITLATVSTDGQPWNSPVYASHDEEYNFFWTSTPTAQHSKNIDATGHVFVVVYDSTQAEGTGLGVYLKGRAYAMTDPDEIDAALGHFYGRKNKAIKPAMDFLEASPRRLYKFIPEQCWMNTDEKVGEFHVDGRVEVKLKK